MFLNLDLLEELTINSYSEKYLNSSKNPESVLLALNVKICIRSYFDLE